MSDALTRDEIIDRFMAHLRLMAHYWTTLPDKSVAERMEGMVFSVLVLLDGGTVLPGFTVCPSQHPDDRAYHEAEGEPYYPENVDIAGELRDHWVNQGAVAGQTTSTPEMGDGAVPASRHSPRHP